MLKIKYNEKQQCTAVANDCIFMMMSISMMSFTFVIESMVTPKAVMNGVAQSTASSDFSMSIDSPCH